MAPGPQDPNNAAGESGRVVQGQLSSAVIPPWELAKAKAPVPAPAEPPVAGYGDWRSQPPPGGQAPGEHVATVPEPGFDTGHAVMLAAAILLHLLCGVLFWAGKSGKFDGTLTPKARPAASTNPYEGREPPWVTAGMDETTYYESMIGRSISLQGDPYGTIVAVHFLAAGDMIEADAGEGKTTTLRASKEGMHFETRLVTGRGNVFPKLVNASDAVAGTVFLIQ